MRHLLAAALLLLLPRLAVAGCAPIAFDSPRIWRAAATDTIPRAGGDDTIPRAGGDDTIPRANGDDTVTITFLGHASFEIVSPQGVRIVTDYNGVNRPRTLPDIATMNHAHATHYTLSPDPRIPHVLHGWAENGVVPQWDLVLRDVRITNLTTNIRTWDGGTEPNGNSIFVFETAGLCIAHLGHLHHLLEPADLAALGRIDVVMVPVDGAWTLGQADMAKVLEALQPHLVLPMHYFTRDVLMRFLDRMRDHYAIELRDSPTLELSRSTLPARPTMVALPGGY
ncbi:MAG: MBL fold metallo-hydrolase [Rhodospirillales bacterium]|nr:MBL fold metallo-hydrolase [Rhodospirillales bacterium]